MAVQTSSMPTICRTIYTASARRLRRRCRTGVPTSAARSRGRMPLRIIWSVGKDAACYQATAFSIAWPRPTLAWDRRGLVLCGFDISPGLRMAEREGFEPPIPVKVYTLSRRAPSATRPSLRTRFEPVDTGILAVLQTRAPQCTASLLFAFKPRVRLLTHSPFGSLPYPLPGSRG